MWDCHTDEFTAVWWGRHAWKMVSLSFLIFVNKVLPFLFFFFLKDGSYFTCDRSDDADVARTPFSLPLSLTQRWSATQSANTLHLSKFSMPWWHFSPSPRYNIPFQPATHHAVSPFCSILPLSSEVLSLPPARQALQFAWNISWHSGIDKLLDVLCGPATDVTE